MVLIGFPDLPVEAQSKCLRSLCRRMPLTYILVDFENVQPQVADLRLLRGEDFRVLVFHGAHQNKFDVGMYKALQPLGDKVQLIQSDRQGPDVLDSHIFFYLGRLLQKHVDDAVGARFFVISKDRDFDSLIVHVRSLGFDAHRVAAIRTALSTTAASSSAPARPAAAKKTAAKKTSSAKKAPAAKAVTAPQVKKAVEARAKEAESPKQLVLDSLRRMGKKRPTKRKGLEHHIESHLGRKVGLDEVRRLVDEMERDGVFRIVDNKVEYMLPKSSR